MKVDNRCDGCVYESDCYEHMIRLGESRTYRCRKLESNMTEIDRFTALIGEAYALKQKMDADKLRMKELNDEISTMAVKNGVIPPAKCSGTISADGITAKISKKDTFKWDQDKLNVARASIGDERFLKVFAFKWEPQNKRVLENFLAHAPESERAVVNDALTISTSYSVAYAKEDA